jgi:hypothetical protein
MNAPRPQDFLRPLEADLAHAVRRIVDTALAELQRLSKGESADRLAARTLLDGRERSRFWQAWWRELTAALQEDRAAPPTAAPDEHPTLASALTLKDKEEIDEDIELARLTQDLESDCEVTLRELRLLYSGLRGLELVDLQAPPLTPQRSAASLGLAVRSLPATPAVRLALLRAVVPAALFHLPSLFAVEVRRLKEAGVEPAAYQVVPSRDFGGAQDEGGSDDVGQRIQAVLNRLQSQAGPAGTPGERPSAAISDAWMDGVLQAVQQEARPSPAMGRLMERLALPGQRLARAEPQIWQQADHAWWALLDRLLALCSVLDGQPGGAQDRFAQQCDAIVKRLLPEDGSVPDSARCRALIEELTTAAQALAAASPVPGEGDAGAPVSGLVKLVREQLSQQLRVSEAPGSLRRFLMGPWLRVLATALDPERGDAGQAQRYTEWVDHVLGALRSDGSAAELAPLLARGREGLASIALPEAQIATWMEDLEQHLEERRQQPSDAPAAEPAWRHEDLPTVPIDLHPSAHGARARRDRIAWINGLRVGDICRLQLEDRWYTVQLVVDPVAENREDEVYVFQSREPLGRHALTRDALVRLRADGLATTVEPGAFIAKALDTLPADLDTRLPRRKPR